MNKYELKNGGYGWIDHVTIDGVAGITLISKEDNQGHIEFFDKNGYTIGTAYLQFCNEIGYCEYNEFGEIDNTTKRIIYEY